MTEPAGVFISYRRQDSAAEAGRLFDRLCDALGSELVFMDVDSIEPGANFLTAIEQALSRCEVLLVVIGPNWLDAADANGRRRLDDPRDLVRVEVVLALRRGIPVIPVLVDGGSEPLSHELPPEMAELAQRQAVALSHARFGSDSQRLVTTVSRVIGRPANRPAASPPAGASRPWTAKLLESTSPALIGTVWSVLVTLTHEAHVILFRESVGRWALKVDSQIVRQAFFHSELLKTRAELADGETVRVLRFEGDFGRPGRTIHLIVDDLRLLSFNVGDPL